MDYHNTFWEREKSWLTALIIFQVGQIQPSPLNSMQNSVKKIEGTIFVKYFCGKINTYATYWKIVSTLFFNIISLYFNAFGPLFF